MEEEMKVKAINTTGAGNLTRNKVYDVIENGTTAYTIKNDLNRNGNYLKERFEIVPEPVAPATFKVGQQFKDEDGDRYILVHRNNLVALATMSGGDICNGFHPVANINSITVAEMCDIDEEWGDNPLTVVV